jgi:hypothetical protein
MSNRLLILVFIVSIVIFYKPAFIYAAAENTKNSQTESAEAKWQAMSAQEKQKLQDETNQNFLFGRLSIGRADQLTIISVIEQQVARLRAAVESFPEDVAKLQNTPEAERAKYTAQLSRAVQDRQQAISAIDAQLAKLKPASTPAPNKETESAVQLNELKDIRQLAVKEKALETVKRLDSFIAKYQQAESKTQPASTQPGQMRPSRPQQN